MFPCVVLSSRSWSIPGYRVTSLMTSSRNNLCRNFKANYRYLGNEARWRNGSNGQPIENCPWAIVWACSRWRHVTQLRHNGEVMIFTSKCFFSGDVPLYDMAMSSRIVYPKLMTSLQRANLIAYWLYAGLIEYSSTSSNFGLWSSHN